MVTVDGEPASRGRGTRFHHGQVATIRAHWDDGGGIDMAVKEGAIVEVEDGVALSHEETDMVENGPTGFCVDVQLFLNGACRIGCCDCEDPVEWYRNVAGDGGDGGADGVGKRGLHGQGGSGRLIHAYSELERSYREGWVTCVHA